MNKKIKELRKQKDIVDQLRWKEMLAIQKEIDKEIEMIIHSDHIDPPKVLFAIEFENNILNYSYLATYKFDRISHYDPDTGYVQFQYQCKHNNGLIWIDINNVKNKKYIDSAITNRGLFLTPDEAISSAIYAIEKLRS